MFWLEFHPAYSHLPFPSTSNSFYSEELQAHVGTCQCLCASSDLTPVLGFLWGCNMWTLLMPSARGRIALGRKLKQPWKKILGSRVGGLGDGVWILGGRIPFTSLTPPPGRGHSWRRTRWGLCGHSSCTWTNLSQKACSHQVAEEMPWGEDGETHASRGRGQSSCSSYSRHWVSHTLIQGLQGDGGT